MTDGKQRFRCQIRGKKFYRTTRRTVPRVVLLFLEDVIHRGGIAGRLVGCHSLHLVHRTRFRFPDTSYSMPAENLSSAHLLNAERSPFSNPKFVLTTTTLSTCPQDRFVIILPQDTTPEIPSFDIAPALPQSEFVPSKWTALPPQAVNLGAVYVYVYLILMITTEC